jgi:pimeloyl-ACP methyl ester carboxylesterase
VAAEYATFEGATVEPTIPGSAPPIPLVLIHGAGGVGQLWQNQLLAFPRAVAPDLPGHPAGSGLSSVADMAAWVLAFLTEKGVGRCVLGGYSLGGAVTIEAGLAAPDRFRGLILIATAARLRVRQEFFDFLAGNYDAAVEDMLRRWFTSDAPPRVVDRARQALRMISPAVVHDDYWAASRFDATERVGRIALPTLILCGESDGLAPRAAELHAKIAGSTFVRVPNAGHLVLLEQPRATNDAIAAFLRTLS